jgi:hypothetical protein
MPCCGAARQQVRTAILAATKPLDSSRAITVAFHRRVDFEYTGSSSLTAIGPVTGRRYEFPQPGATLTVDARDAAALLSVPKLRRLQRR